MDLIGENVRLYWDQAVYKTPGTEDEFPWHQDNGVGTTAVDNTEMITVWFPLDDATVEKGCLAILPRSHKLGLLVHCPTKANGIPDDSFDVASTVPMPMKRGGIFVKRGIRINHLSSGHHTLCHTRLWCQC